MVKKKREGRRLQLGEAKESSSPAGAEGKEHDAVDTTRIVDVVEPDTPTKNGATKPRAVGNNGDGADDDDGKEDSTSHFFTPRKAAATAATITPSPAAKKRRALLTETPEKKKKKKKVSRRTTVAEELVAEEEGGEEPYVPKYIHDNVSYTRFGMSNNNLSDGQKAAFNFIAENYVLPLDFETNRRYGPLSGLCYEERAIAAYTINMLQPKADADIALLNGGVCSSCGTIGHKKVRCPDLI
mmetsp:Transcript_18123/g.39583  ORF Transcript_18123/g.39583 Transcript_18123/m.39583 type:complete len:241 (+) Transcript_18123:135-857(+)|eukprot:CAMPEP_0178477788 /NCGR_PEP_ID=MMETSP0696-20121128/4314_1 /TAXON_ID=265572 /ORGANISM="Extubocellulus spinifer, Strain CCMP396" /LENGTH=240 /DNA_ID=CAMNT_0020105115 /DNA_START=95 /DNA_END=817 /DNA_ORIENTATION=+